MFRSHVQSAKVVRTEPVHNTNITRCKYFLSVWQKVAENPLIIRLFVRGREVKNMTATKRENICHVRSGYPHGSR